MSKIHTRTRIWSILLVCAMLVTMLPVATAAGETTWYVSAQGQDTNAGTEDSPFATLEKATEAANQAGTPAEIVVLGQITVDSWTTPTVETTLRGGDEDAELVFEYHSALDHQYNISLAGPLTINSIKLNCNYTSYKFSTYYGTYSIAANGYPLVIGAETKYNYYTSRVTDNGKTYETSVCHIVGGSLNSDISGGTHVEIYASLPLTYVYGGGLDGSVGGDVYLHIENCGKVQHVRAGGYADERDATVGGSVTLEFIRSVTDNAVYGGGYTAYGTSCSAAVEGNVSIQLEGLNQGFGKPIYGGGYGVNAPVNGNVTITADNINLTNNKASIYGGGYEGAVNGNVQIAVTNSTISSDIFGGGYKGLVDGNVEISITNYLEVISDIYGGGERGGDVNGAVSITLTPGEKTTDYSCPTIYATGEGSSTDAAEIGGGTSITLNGGRGTVYTLGNYGAVADGKSVTVTLDDTGDHRGASRSDTGKTQYLYNYESRDHSNSVQDAKVIVQGDYTATGIVQFDRVEIKNGGTLREHLSDNGKAIFSGVSDLAIEAGGTLDLLQSNELAGTADISGTLTLPQAAELTADGQVTVGAGALFAPSDGYLRGDVFLRSKTAYTQGEQPEFEVTQAGKDDHYFTKNRTVTSGEVVHKWYVDQPESIVIVPASISIYTGGTGYKGTVDEDGTIVSDNSGFPTPGFLITLPDSLKQALEADGKDISDLVLQEVNGTKTWTIEHYDGQSETQVYKLKAADGQDPVRVQFIDKNTGTAVPDDKFDVSTVINETLEMSLYRNQVGEVTVTYGGTTYLIDADGTAELFVRGTTSDAEYGFVKTAGTEIAKDTCGVVAPEGTTYTINKGSGHVEVTDKTAVALLFDEIIETNNVDDVCNTDLLKDRADTELKDSEVLSGQGTRHYEIKYLDLVDTSNGNVWVTADKDIQVYWPLPEGTTKNTKFELLHFEGLHREMGVDKVADQIESCSVTPVTIDEITDTHIVFTVGTAGFSPFALVWETTSSGGGGGGTTYYTLTYESNGGTTYEKERYASGTTVQLTKSPVREGYTFTGWYADKELTDAISSIKMTSNKTVYAGWEATDTPGWLNGDDHFAYVIGYDDGTVRPLDNITRSEVAAIFFRLLRDEVREEYLTESNTFADVTDGMWHNTAISTLAAMGILEGRSETCFDPNAPITRAEFAAICARFSTEDNVSGTSFTDIKGHWAEKEIQEAASLGWILGRDDGTFGPDLPITRAEAMTMINRVLCRLPETEDDLLDDMIVWPDNQPDTWYYLAVQEATNSHDFQRKDDVHERWTALRQSIDWTQYQ